jgi:hypothetical protein
VFTARCELNLEIRFRLILVFKGNAMAQAVSRRPTNAEARFRSQVSPCEICDGQRDRVTRFSPTTSFSTVRIIPPMLYIHLHLDIAHIKWTKVPPLGTFQQTVLVQKSGSMASKCFRLLFNLLKPSGNFTYHQV